MRSHIVKVPILSTIHANEAIARSLSTERALSPASTSTLPIAAQKDRLLELRIRRKTALLLQPPLTAATTMRSMVRRGTSARYNLSRWRGREKMAPHGIMCPAGDGQALAQ